MNDVQIGRLSRFSKTGFLLILGIFSLTLPIVTVPILGSALFVIEFTILFTWAIMQISSTSFFYYKTGWVLSYCH